MASLCYGYKTLVRKYSFIITLCVPFIVCLLSIYYLVKRILTEQNMPVVGERTHALSIALVLVLVYSWVGILLRLRCGHHLENTVVMIEL